MPSRFRDRFEAGRFLGKALSPYAGRADVLVLGLPRGGVPVAFEVARALNAPLDTFLVRKLGVPGQEELAMGAIATGGVRVLNEDIVEELGISEEVIDRVVTSEERELARRERRYRGTKPPPPIRGRTVILVDDGLATGSSMKAALVALREQEPAHVAVGVPVAARATCEELAHEVDDIVCLLTPEPFQAVGLWYDDFGQISDEDVQELLELAAREHDARIAGGDEAFEGA